MNLSSTVPLVESVRNAHSDKIKSLLDNRASVVTAMSLLTLYIAMDIFIPKTHNSETSSYYSTIKVILGALTILTLGNMLLKTGD